MQGLTAEEALSIANQYTDDSMQGAGAVAGKPCQIQSITEIEDGKRVTFLWEDNAGTQHTSPMDVKNGDPGQDGAPGQDGHDGHDGAAATIQVGSVTQGAAPSVTNSGTESAARFDFVLPKGDRGEKGEKGDDGQDGKSFEIKAQYATYEDLIAEHPTGEPGDAYFVGEGTSPDLYVWLEASQIWYNNGPIAGIKGDKGDKGDDGFSPTANVVKVGSIVTITITDKNGTTTETVSDGAKGDKGDDGNGIASITKTSSSGLIDVYTITFTNGTTSTFSVTNGAQGPAGPSGQDGEDGTDGTSISKIEKTGTSGLVDTYTVTLTDGSTSTFTVTNGANGQDGQNGQDGTDGEDGNGIASVEKTSTSGLVDTYTITFTNGSTTTFTVTNGADGADGQDGAPGTPGTNGENGNGIASIEKTSTSGLVDTYTVTFTNGTTTTFNVTNGADGQDGEDGEGVPTGGTAKQILIKKSATDFDAQWADFEAITPTGAGARNVIFRGKYLGTSVTAEQYAAISNGTFEGLMLGDYWTINGVNWRIAAFDYWLHDGDTECTDHHVVIVPDTNLYSAAMNDTNVTTGGYVGSKMYTANLATAKSTINSAFGSAHILSHKELLTKAVSGDKASDWGWYASTVELMNEVMVYGCNVWSSHPGYETGIDKVQLPLFAARPDLITNRAYWWLRSVVSSAGFAYVADAGVANGDGASYSLGVRPAFAICAA